jgi:hypothetical protein
MIGGKCCVDALLMQFVEDVLGRRREDFLPRARHHLLDIRAQARHENLRNARAHA